MDQRDTQLAMARASLAKGDAASAQKLLNGTDYVLDPQTGQIRDKTWWEDHGDTVGFLADAAGALIPAVGGAFAGASGATNAATAGGKDMGFFDTLKSGLDAFNKVSGPISQMAGGIEKGRASGLVEQAKLQQQQDMLRQARAKLALAAPGMEASNATRGDVLANSQDATISGLPSYLHVPEISGGLRPSMLSASSRALGSNMSRQAMLNNLSGADVPDLTPLPESNGYDTALQAVGQGAGFLNAASGLFKQQPKPMVTDPSQVDESAGGTGGLDPSILQFWKTQAMPGAGS